jgi:hypothetical protein
MLHICALFTCAGTTRKIYIVIVPDTAARGGLGGGLQLELHTFRGKLKRIHFFFLFFSVLL